MPRSRGQSTEQKQGHRRARLEGAYFMACNYRISLITSLIVILGTLSAAQQNQPLLQITSPNDGTVVNPGQTMTVVVSSPAGVSFNSVVLRGEDPIGFSNAATAVPATFSITIPAEIDCRKYSLRALGATAAGDVADSDFIDLDVERADMPLSLSSQFPSLTMEAQGQVSPMMLTATFSDGSALQVTESTKVTYQSTNTLVFTVDGTGAATAVAPGNASLIATYQNSNGPNLQLSIPVTVLPFDITFTPASLDFGNATLGSSVSRSITITNASASDSGLSIKSVGAGGPYSETDNCISTSPLALDGTCTISVTFSPTALGQSQGSLRIDNSSTVVSSVINLTGIGTAIPPSITGFESDQGAPTVGAPLIILGTSFGATQGSSTVVIGGITVAPTSWSDTSVGINVPSGLPVGYFDVTVTVNGMTSNARTFYLVPGINSISPTFGPVGTSVTISGTSFGATQGSSTIDFCGGQPTSWSDTAIVVPVVDSTGSCTPTVTLYTTGGPNTSWGGSNQSLYFDLSPPVITGLSPTSGQVGTFLSISGSNFGSGNTYGTVTVNGLPATVEYWTPSVVAVLVPDGATSGNVVVTSSHGVSSNAVPFTVTSPVGWNFSPASSTTPGLLQLAFVGFGTTTLPSQDLANQPAGDYLIQAFDTQAGDPGTSVIWPAGMPAWFTVTLQQVAGTPGTLFPEVQLFLNNASGTPVCSAIGTNAITATQAQYSLTCSPASDIVVTSTDRYYLWVGFNSTQVVSTSLQAQLVVGRTGTRGNSTIFGSLTVPVH